jgi:superfamily I DNA/RNA helicase
MWVSYATIKGMLPQAHYLTGPPASGKTAGLLAHMGQWLAPTTGDVSNGAMASQPGQWLVLASNSQRKQTLLHRLREQHPTASADRSVYTFTGWVRTVLYDHWPRAEAQLLQTGIGGTPVIQPELTSYRDSEQMLTLLTQKYLAQHPDAFADLPGGLATRTHAIVRQLLRRLRQRTENRLTRQTMRTRSQWLQEPCLNAVNTLEMQFDRLSYQLRLLDPSKQQDLFHRLLTADPNFTQWLHQRTQYVAVDDWDETTPSQQAFILALQPQQLVVTCDPDGGSRRGYLNAHPYDWPTLLAQWPGQVTKLTNPPNPLWASAATHMLHRWKGAEQPSENTTPQPQYERHHLDTPQAQTEQLLTTLTQWQQAGYALGQMAIACPQLEATHQYQLQQVLQGVAVQWLSGTQTPWRHQVLRVFVLLVQWLNQPQWQSHPLWQQAPLTAPDQRDILRFWQNPLWQQGFTQAGLQAEASLQPWWQFCQQWANQPFEQQLLPLFRQFVGPYANTTQPLDALTTLLQRIATRFVPIQTALGPADTPVGLAWVHSIRQGHIAENPKQASEVDPDCLVIGTPQKLIDAEVRRPCYIWLDVDSPEWNRTDNAPLYDAWVHSAAWQDGLLPELAPPGIPQDEWLVRIRAGHITRGLMMLVTEQLVCLSAETDVLNRRQPGGLLADMLPLGSLPTTAPAPLPVLRPDQQPILAYQQGTMAVSAVPGAGKTFVTVALLLQLIQQQQIPPERILVLTYMDSAAKTLLNRLRPYLGSRLPKVSTIHSLAHRIVRHGNHAIRLGLDPDALRIVDDTTQQAFLEQVAQTTLPQGEGNPKAWGQLIAMTLRQLKTHGQSLQALQTLADANPNDARFAGLYQAVALYQQLTHGWLDFDDLIQLSITLLTQHDDVKAYYQQHIECIIEDEAQDSSEALQQLLGLLGGASPNLIRTGDPNQSITATFTGANAAVFRQFIQTAHRHVSMDGSGRCAPEIMMLANQWVTLCTQPDALPQAFMPVAMQPVPPMNPRLLRLIQRHVAPNRTTEQLAMVQDVITFTQQHPTASMAVLARFDWQLKQYAQALIQAGVPIVASHAPPLLEETLNAFIAWLWVLKAPENPDALTELLQALAVLNPNQWPQPEALPWMAPDLPERPAPPAWAITQLNAIHHPLAQRLYYDWLDFSRLLAEGLTADGVLRLGFSLSQDPAIQPIIRGLADLTRFDLQTTQDPAGWLCQHHARLKEGLTKTLKRQQDGVVPQGHVLLSTMHAAKGQEYDGVWLPDLTSDSYPTALAHLKPRTTDALEITLIQRFGTPAPAGMPVAKHRDAIALQLKQAKLEEEARLIYVGITRARQSLWLSAALQDVPPKGKPTTLLPHPLVEN